jgi:hypothetical protein
MSNCILRIDGVKVEFFEVNMVIEFLLFGGMGEGGMRLEVGGWKHEVRRRKSDAGSGRREAGSRMFDAGCWK